jgi:hypothetical protein
LESRPVSWSTLISRIDAAHATWKLSELDGDGAAMTASTAQLEQLAKRAQEFATRQSNLAVRRLLYDTLVEVARDVPSIGAYVQAPWT